jgi:carboxymethylenebutenolidase
MLLPKVLNAAAVTESEVTIKTSDGTADAYFVHPSTGAAPGVLMWPDIFGLRPAFRQMGKRLAESGWTSNRQSLKTRRSEPRAIAWAASSRFARHTPFLTASVQSPHFTAQT